MRLSQLRSILHSNRAFAYVKLKKWAEAEADCSAALALNKGNTKARYRRSMAYVELGRHSEALQDVDQVVKEMPDPNNNKEAMDLRERILQLQTAEMETRASDDSGHGPLLTCSVNCVVPEIGRASCRERV